MLAATHSADSMDNEELSTADRLLQKIDASPGFATLNASVQTLGHIGEDAECDARTITQSILRDAALTGRLLQAANSGRGAHPSARDGRNISTIDQALAILGLNTVKSIALSLEQIDALNDPQQRQLLRAETISAYFCAYLAGELTRLYAPRINHQEAHICGQLQNLGRIMSIYHLYDEIERSRQLQIENNIAEHEATVRAFGISFDEISIAVARHWRLPDILQDSIAPDFGKAPPRNAMTAREWHQYCASFSRRIANALFRLPENREQIEITREIEFFRDALHLKNSETRETIQSCLQAADAAFAAIAYPCTLSAARKLLRKASERVLDRIPSQDRLTKARNRIGGRTPAEIIQSVLFLIHRKYNFDRTLLCLPDSSSGLMAIAGVGANANTILPRFRCHGSRPDIFRAFMARKIDVFVADIHAPAYSRLIPDWYRRNIDATSFVLLPLVFNKKPIGMIYADYATRHSHAPQQLAEGQMKEWRDQLIEALQKGAPSGPVTNTVDQSI